MIMDKAGGSGERRFLKREWLGTVSVDCPEGQAEAREGSSEGGCIPAIAVARKRQATATISPLMGDKHDEPLRNRFQKHPRLPGNAGTITRMKR
jgi:hypothetical protein